MGLYKKVPFKGHHLRWLMQAGDAEGGFGPPLSEEHLGMLESTKAVTAVLEDGTVLACGGLIEQWPGRYTAWAYLNIGTAEHMLFVTKVARSLFKSVKGRIECTVRCDYKKGHRWAKMLGFRVETDRMEAYGPEGEDHTAYVMVNR